jgi:anti-sigma B factor antagonist
VSVHHDARLDCVGPTTRLILTGEIDMNAADDVHRRAEEAVAGSPQAILVDLTDVTFLDSAGVGVLVLLNNAARDRSIPVQLRRGKPGVMRVLDIVGVTSVFELVDE